MVDADGSSNTSVFTLISGGDEPTNDAAIGILPTGAQVTGNVTVQRFMTRQGGTNQRIYRYISSPVQQGTVADIQNEIPVTGSFIGSSTCTGCLTNPSLFYYDETVITDTNGSGTTDLADGYIEFPDVANTEIFIPGLGYALFTRGNILPSTLWDLRGVINVGNVTPVTLPVTFTPSGSILDDGWNLVGNPFPSTIDWNASNGWTKINLDGAFYITDNGSSSSIQYAAWNGTTGTNGGTQYIATGQAFWVKANGSGTPVLQTDENVKTPGTQTTFFREGTPENLLRIALVQGNVRDETVIHFRDDATSSFDSHADAVKLVNGTFNLSTMIPDGMKLAINSLTSLACREEVMLVVENVSPGDYHLAFSELNSFPEGVMLQLHDAFLDQTFPIEKDSKYAFNVNSDIASYGFDRFTVIILEPPAAIDIQVKDNILIVPFTEGIQWYFNGEALSGATSPSLEAQEPGLYEVKISIDGCNYTGAYEHTITDIENIAATIQVHPNPVKDELNIVISNSNYSTQVVLFDLLGQICGYKEIQHEGVFEMRHLPDGVYTIRVKFGSHVITKKIIKQ